MAGIYGVMEIKPKSTMRTDTKHYNIVITAHPDVIDVIKRLMPSSRSRPFTVSASSENVRMLSMVLSEYPLQIVGKDRWYGLLMEMNARKDVHHYISSPVRVTPNPKYFTGVLMPFQKYGLDFLQRMDGNAILADEMGLGKTVQTLAFVAQRRSIPVIVVAPLVTLINWKREIQRFLRLPFKSKYAAPRVSIIRSGREEPLDESDFYLINYEIVHKRLKDIINTNPRLVVFDEIHNLRHSNTYKIHACTELANYSSVKHRIGLSGTPIYNRGEDMHSIAEVVKPGIFGTKEQFKKKFYAIDRYGLEDLKDKDLSVFLQKNLTIRRKKTDVLKELPKKYKIQQTVSIDTNMYIENIRKMYLQLEDAKKELDAATEGAEKKRRLAEFNGLLLEMRVAERQIAGLAKAPHIVEYVSGLLDDYEDENFVIFCHHRKVHQILADGLRKYYPLKILGGQSDAIRQKAIDVFQRNASRRVLICGLRAGSVGINLTKASYAIFAELDWSPAIHSQAEDRLHRIGQKNFVFSHYLVGEGTFDEYIADILTSKSNVISKILGEKAESTDNKKVFELFKERFSASSGLVAKGLQET